MFKEGNGPTLIQQEGQLTSVYREKASPPVYRENLIPPVYREITVKPEQRRYFNQNVWAKIDPELQKIKDLVNNV